jgi:hypothetical protein
MRSIFDAVYQFGGRSCSSSWIGKTQHVLPVGLVLQDLAQLWLGRVA